MLIEYPAVVVGIPIALWAVVRGRSRAAIYGILGSIAPFVVLALYDLAAFGTILPVGYEHSTLWQDEHQQGFLSITHPTWDAIWGLSFSPFRGLFFSAPVLLLAVVGVWFGLRGAVSRPATVVTLSGFAAIFLIIGSSVMWWGGFAAGPRYLVPGIPLLGIPLGFVISRINGSALPRRIFGFLVIAALSATSIALTWSLTFAGQNYPPDGDHSPLRQYVLPAFKSGNISRNLGNVLQLSGIASLAPLLFIMIAGAVIIAIQLRPRRSGHPAFVLVGSGGPGSPKLGGNR